MRQEEAEGREAGSAGSDQATVHNSRRQGDRVAGLYQELRVSSERK